MPSFIPRIFVLVMRIFERLLLPEKGFILLVRYEGGISLLEGCAGQDVHGVGGIYALHV